MDFDIGTEVVCISDGWKVEWPDYHLQSYPVKENVYTIRGKTIDDWGTGLLLIGVQNPPVKFPPYIEPGFRIANDDGTINFRPVKKTNIDQFKQLLVPVGPKVLEPA